MPRKAAWERATFEFHPVALAMYTALLRSEFTPGDGEAVMAGNMRRLFGR